MSRSNFTWSVWYHLKKPQIEDNTMVKRKRTNNDLQNTTKKTQDRSTRTPLTTGCDLKCSGRVSISSSTSVIRRVTLATNPVINHEWRKDQQTPLLYDCIPQWGHCFFFLFLGSLGKNLIFYEWFFLHTVCSLIYGNPLWPSHGITWRFKLQQLYLIYRLNIDLFPSGHLLLSICILDTGRLGT